MLESLAVAKNSDADLIGARRCFESALACADQCWPALACAWWTGATGRCKQPDRPGVSGPIG